MTVNNLLCQWRSYFFILVGITLAIVNLVHNRSLWIDEAMLANNIINRGFADLARPLDLNQVAPIGFLWIEKLFSSLIGNTDMALRVFPFIAYLTSVLLAYLVGFQVFHDKLYASFVGAIVAANYNMLFYSTEVKQYMVECLTASYIMFCTNNYLQTKRLMSLYTLAAVGCLSIWLSNTAVLMLFSAFLFLFKKSTPLIQQVKPLSILAIVWGLWYAVYYGLFILNHPTRDFMVEYHTQTPAFLDIHVFNSSFYTSIAHKIVEIVRLTGYGKTSLLWLPVLLCGIYRMSASAYRHQLLFFFLLPVSLHLGLAALKIYPFDLRLILYLLPITSIIVAAGMKQVFLLTADRFKIPEIQYLNLALSAGICIVALRGFPIQREEITRSLNCIESEISPADYVYVYYSSIPAFDFYRKRFPNINNLDQKKIIHGHSNRNNWDLYKDDIPQTNQVIWLVFSHMLERKNMYGVSEEQYIVGLFGKEGYHVLFKQHFKGAAVYKIQRKSQAQWTNTQN